MELKHFSYFLLLVLTFLISLFLGFKYKTGIFSKLKYLIPAVIFSGTIFIIWDLRFEERTIWSFNPEFLIGSNILNLPIEEWFYFIAIPFLGVSIYEYVKQRFYNFEYPNTFLSISLALFILFAVIAYFSRQKMYPFFTFFLLAIYLGYTIFRNRFKKHYTKFYLAYFITLIPFLIISGTLTQLPVIEYNPVHYLGILIYTIPVENFASLFLLLLMNITIYEYLTEHRIY